MEAERESHLKDHTKYHSLILKHCFIIVKVREGSLPFIKHRIEIWDFYLFIFKYVDTD